MAFDIKDPETAAAIAKIVEDELEKAGHAGVADLKKKNYELMEKLRIAKKGQEIDPAEHAAVQVELEAIQVKLSEAVKAAKIANTEAEKIRKAYEIESKVAHDLLVKQGLSAALLANGVKNPAYLEAAEALLYSKVVLTADGENRVAKVGDKLLADYVKEWTVSDKGKAFVDAPGNSGGGAHGGGGGGGNVKTMTRAAFEALSPLKRTEFSKDGGQLTAG